jgi:Collagen triple helix repeat (20 copies)
MRISRGSLAALSCAAVLALVGCGAEDGSDGADGLPGADGAKGTDGTNGLDGDKGAKGNDGAKGADGASVLVVTSDEPEGENCPEGGKRIDTGLDANDNGVLDPNEKGTPTYVCNGAPGKDGASTRIRTKVELAGEHCAYGGVAIQTGLDANRNGALDDAEVDASATSFICNTAPAWAELRALPSVTTAYSYALSVNDVDGSARLGFMFTDAAYRATLASEGALWDGGGVYSGNNVFAVYNLQGFGAQASWKAYQGRYTPQYYAYSELTFDNGSSYYTTNYSSFGGLVSVVKDGMQGTYALTPAYTPGRAHSVAFADHVLYALIAQKNVGLTLSTFPVASFGNLSNLWVNRATIVPAATAVSAPKLINAGGTLVGAYLSGGNATIRATKTPATVSTAADFVEVGSCAGAVRVDVAWADGKLFAGCVDGAGTLTLRKADIASLDAVAWEPVATAVTGAVSELDLSGLGTRLALAVRQGTAVRAYGSASDTTPSFDAVLPGSFDLQVAKEGLVLSVCDLTGNKTVRTFWH